MLTSGCRVQNCCRPPGTTARCMKRRQFGTCLRQLLISKKMFSEAREWAKQSGLPLRLVEDTTRMHCHTEQGVAGDTVVFEEVTGCLGRT